jgi:hypothetical protein
MGKGMAINEDFERATAAMDAAAEAEEKRERERFAPLFKADRARKEAYLKANPDFEPDGDFWDAHSCAEFSDGRGCCQWCGGLAYGSSAYRGEYGGE